MTRFTTTVLTRLCAAGIAALIAGSVGAQEVTLRMHQFLPANANVPEHILDVWADKVEADSDGRIRILRFPSMQLGGTPPQLYDQAVDGVADLVWTVAGYTPGRFPQSEVFELPFMMTTPEATSRAFYTLAQWHMMDSDFKDVRVLALWVHGPGQIHTNRPVTDVADLDGMKLRAPSRTTTMLFSQLGATSIGMPVPAVPEALSKGVIDGAALPWEVTESLRVPELVTYHTEFGDASLYTLAFIFAMNPASYDALPDDLQAVIDANSGLEFSAFAARTQASYDAPARQIAVDRGNTIITLNDTQIAAWKTASEGTIDLWTAEMDAKGFDGAALVAEARALIAENDTSPE